jgi:hypothetical protein
MKTALHMAAEMLASKLSKDAQPSVNDVLNWYNHSILPLRSSTPYTIDRFKGYIRMLYGNQPDVNGVCGDVVSFLFIEFEKEFGHFIPQYAEFNIGAVLKTGSAHFNHISVILYPFSLDNMMPVSIRTNNTGIDPASVQFPEDVTNGISLLENNIMVLDLFYKEQSKTLKEWIVARNYKNVELKIGREENFADSD